MQTSFFVTHRRGEFERKNAFLFLLLSIHREPATQKLGAAYIEQLIRKETQGGGEFSIVAEEPGSYGKKRAKR